MQKSTSSSTHKRLTTTSGKLDLNLKGSTVIETLRTRYLKCVCANQCTICFEQSFF